MINKKHPNVMLSIKEVKHSAVLKRIILPYISIVLISTIVFSGVITFFTGRINTALVQSQEQNLKFYSNNVDNIINSVNNITTQICFNSIITNPQNYFSPVGRMNIIKTIADFTVDSRNKYELLLFSDYSDYIYSRDSTYTKDSLRQVYKFDGADELFAGVFSLDELTIMPAVALEKDGKQRRVIPIAFPNLKKSFAQKITLLYLVDEDVLINNTDIKNPLIFVKNDNGEIISGSEKISGIGSIEIGSLKKNKKNIIDKKKYYTFVNTGKILDISYIMLLEVGKIDFEIYKLIGIIFFFTFFILVLSGFLVWQFIKKDFSVFDGLIDTLEGMVGKKYDNYKEFKVIENDVRDIVEDVKATKKFNSENKDIFNDVFLEKVLQGSYDSVKYINAFQLYSNIYFRFDNFFAATFLFGNENIGEMFSAIKKRERLSENYDIFFKKSDKLNVFNAVVCMDDEKMAKKFMEEMRFSFAEEFECDVTVGLSSPTRDISHIWQSYIQAASALDYRLVKGVNTVLQFTDFATESESAFYPTEQISSLGTYLEQGNTEKINPLIDEIFASATKLSNLYMVRYLCFDVINTIVKHINIATGKKIETNTINIMKFDTIDQLASEVKAYCINECMKTGEENNEFEAILDFVKKNYTQPDLSVSTISRYFKIPQTTLYDIFKSNLSITPLQYISNLRIEAVKDMLINSDIAISTIVQNVGRYDTSSFIRKFKSQVGMTPGEYRKYYTTK